MDPHVLVVNVIALQASKSGHYSSIYLDMGWTAATSGRITSKKRPDIVGIRKDGKIDVWEVESETDNAYVLMNRIQSVLNEAPIADRGSCIVVRPSGIVKVIDSVNSKGKALTPIRLHADCEEAFSMQKEGFIVVEPS